MSLPELATFRLVGGTALSLLRGHRISEDIDLFTDSNYGNIPFQAIESKLRDIFPYVLNSTTQNIPVLAQHENNSGLHLFIGASEEDRIKTDIIYWNAEYIFPPVIEENIRLATVEEIAAMKLDVIGRGGRKKDFWDLSEIFETHELQELLKIYEQKYPYFDVNDVIIGLTDFTSAEEFPDPVCLKGKHWEVIQEEMKTAVKALQ